MSFRVRQLRQRAKSSCQNWGSIERGGGGFRKGGSALNRRGMQAGYTEAARNGAREGFRNQMLVEAGPLCNMESRYQARAIGDGSLYDVTDMGFDRSRCPCW